MPNTVRLHRVLATTPEKVYRNNWVSRVSLVRLHVAPGASRFPIRLHVRARARASRISFEPPRFHGRHSRTRRGGEPILWPISEGFRAGFRGAESPQSLARPANPL